MRVERDGHIEIRRPEPVEMIDATLSGETRRHYLMCARGCGTLLNVPWPVLAAMCAACIQRDDDG